MKVEPIYLTWLNPLGGYEYFYFRAENEFQMDIMESGQMKTNTFPNWPKSWGETADTVDKKTFTQAKYKRIVRSQLLTPNQRDIIAQIKVSPCVQVVYSRTNRKTVLVDTDSFKIYDESEKVYSVQFTITDTDEIATQRA